MNEVFELTFPLADAEKSKLLKSLLEQLNEALEKYLIFAGLPKKNWGKSPREILSEPAVISYQVFIRLYNRLIDNGKIDDRDIEDIYLSLILVPDVTSELAQAAVAKAQDDIKEIIEAEKIQLIELIAKAKLSNRFIQ